MVHFELQFEVGLSRLKECPIYFKAQFLFFKMSKLVDPKISNKACIRFKGGGGGGLNKCF